MNVVKVKINARRLVSLSSPELPTPEPEPSSSPELPTPEPEPSSYYF